MNEWRAISSSDFLPRAFQQFIIFVSFSEIGRRQVCVVLLVHDTMLPSYFNTEKVKICLVPQCITHPQQIQWVILEELWRLTLASPAHSWNHNIEFMDSHNTVAERCVVIITLITVNSRNSKHHPFSFGGNPLCAHTIHAPITLPHTPSPNHYICGNVWRQIHIQSTYDSVSKIYRNIAFVLHMSTDTRWFWVFIRWFIAWVFVYMDFGVTLGHTIFRFAHIAITNKRYLQSHNLPYSPLFELHNLRHAR